MVPLVQGDGTITLIPCKAVDTMGVETNTSPYFEEELFRQLGGSKKDSKIYFTKGRKIDLLLGARNCGHIIKIAPPSEFGFQIQNAHQI